MQERDPEYDRFGPWVLEISDEDPPPPLFLPHLEMDRAALLRIKIPRRVERRNARPGMNLYDYVISLFDDEVEVLQRVEDSVKSTSFRYTDVKRVVHREDLLRGDIDVVLKDTTVELPFSTISSDLMGQLVAIIRRRYVDESRLVDVNAITPPQAESQSFYFRGLLRGLRSESPHVRLIGFQNEVPLGRYHEGFFRTMFFRVVGKRLLETLYLTDGSELQFLDQGRTYAQHQWRFLHTGPR
jgi:hypothetical protein